MWIMYVIQNTVSKERYFGTTQNLKERLQAHNNSGKKFTTRNNGKWILVYAEAYRSKEDALLRERRLKVHGRGKLELIKRIQKSLLD